MTITVEYKGHFGDDKSIADNARVSFDSDADKYTEAQNENLLKYLATGLRTSEREKLLDCLEISSREFISETINKYRKTPTHWVPFAHTFVKLVCNAPVPIRTQC